jgi:multicomponent Na+:H+ antiporter subunit E
VTPYWCPRMVTESNRGWFTAAITRGVGFLVLWLALAGFDIADLPAAVVAVVGATLASLRLLPPSAGHISLSGVAALVLRFPFQAIAAGVDVARRALDPRLPLRPGFVTFAPRLSPGLARDEFCALASLMPGTLPADTNADGSVLVHCLDVDQPAAEQLRVEEALFIRALGNG